MARQVWRLGKLELGGDGTGGELELELELYLRVKIGVRKKKWEWTKMGPETIQKKVETHCKVGNTQ